MLGAEWIAFTVLLWVAQEPSGCMAKRAMSTAEPAPRSPRSLNNFIFSGPKMWKAGETTIVQHQETPHVIEHAETERPNDSVSQEFPNAVDGLNRTDLNVLNLDPISHEWKKSRRVTKRAEATEILFGGFEKARFVGMKNDKHKIRKRFILRDPRTRWDKGIVPYKMTNEVKEKEKEHILKAMSTFQKYTCIRFVPYESNDYHGKTANEHFNLSHPGHIIFTSSSKCWSVQGNSRRAEGQEITCCDPKACMHELGHTMGLYHEQSNPESLDWIRVNFENIGDGKDSYVLHHEGISYGYDISSAMQYKLGNPRRPEITAFSPELKPKWEFYYLLREVSLAHNCHGEYCKTFRIKCVNDGYLTLVRGLCACRCPPGLDPRSGCATILKTSPAEEFPGGAYALPQPESGCPASEFQIGYRVHFGESETYQSTLYTLKGKTGTKTQPDRKVEDHFCVQTHSSRNTTWPIGNYCIYRKGGSCPGGFTEGSVQFGDRPTQGEPQIFSGVGPDGGFNKSHTEYEFCCRNDGFFEDPMILPAKKPFALFQHSINYCQEILGTRLSYAYMAFVNSGAFHELKGFNPVTDLSKNGKEYHIKHCYYTPLNMDCGGVIELTSQNSEVTFSSPPGNNMKCTWLIKVPKGETILINFSEFEVKGNPYKHYGCEDELEIRYNRIGQNGHKYCGTKMVQSIRSWSDKMLLRFSVGESGASKFTATAKLVAKEEHCYQVEDGGATYDGCVNYTRDYKPCLKWVEAAHCPHNPFNPDDAFDRLEENYCRNPGNGVRPWCYTKADGCKRNYCDVCLLEKKYDLLGECDEIKKNGQCDDNFLTCAKTCQSHFPFSGVPTKAKGVKCKNPQQAANRELVSEWKRDYAVGEKVAFKCSVSNATVESKCLTSGEWSEVEHACLLCPINWRYLAETSKCYRYFRQKLLAKEANGVCAAYGGHLVDVKIQQVNDLLATINEGAVVWIGASVEGGKWVWSDGTPFHKTYTNWARHEPINHIYEETHKCAYMRLDKFWKSYFCSVNRSFVCERQSYKRPICQDVLAECSNFFQAYPTFCITKRSFANEFCPFTCGLCDSGSTKSCRVTTPHPGVVHEDIGYLTRGSITKFWCKPGYVVVGGSVTRGCDARGELTGTELKCAVPKKQCHNTTIPPAVELKARGNFPPHATATYAGNNDNLRITKHGKVVRWEFHTQNPAKLAFQIWRSTQESLTYQLIGQNKITTLNDRVQRYEVPENEQIEVRKGDFIGIYYNEVGGVSFDYVSKTEHPEATNVRNCKKWKANADDFVIGKCYEFYAKHRNSDSLTIQFSMRAVVGPADGKCSK